MLIATLLFTWLYCDGVLLLGYHHVQAYVDGLGRRRALAGMTL
jgi:hypothetical protein